MPLEGFGSEVSLTAIVLLALKVARDYVKERRERQYAVKIINGNPGKSESSNRNGKVNVSGTSTNIVLHVLDEQGGHIRKLEKDISKLGEDMTTVRVDLAKVKTRLNMKEEEL